MMVLILCCPILQAGVWTDDFDKQALDKAWKFRDRREKETKVEVKDGVPENDQPQG